MGFGIAAPVIWASVAGVGFGCLGSAYRLGQARGVTPTQIGLVIAAVGCAVFGWRVRGQEWGAPEVVWVLGIGVGLSQYLVIRLIGPALARGPLSPLWCAVNLGFVVAVVYAAVCLDERPSLAQYAGLAAAAGSVLAASLGQPGTTSPKGPAGREAGAAAVYGALLLLILGLNGLSPTFLKYLSAQPAAGGISLVAAFADLYYLVFYATLAILVFGDLLITRAFHPRIMTLLGVGLLGGVGSVVGMGAWALASSLPAAVLFTVSSVVSILVAAVASVAGFGEKRSAAWHVTVGLAIAAVVLANARWLGG